MSAQLTTCTTAVETYWLKATRGEAQETETQVAGGCKMPPLRSNQHRCTRNTHPHQRNEHAHVHANAAGRCAAVSLSLLVVTPGRSQHLHGSGLHSLCVSGSKAAGGAAMMRGSRVRRNERMRETEATVGADMSTKETVGIGLTRAFVLTFFRVLVVVRWPVCCDML